MTEDKGFEIRDRRKVTAEGEMAGDTPEAAPGAEADEAHDTNEFPPVDFISFIGSLAASALMNLGEALSPGQPGDTKNLAAAKQMIDLIDLLREKTRGNLTDEESRAMDTLLYNLRMRYIRESGGGK